MGTATLVLEGSAIHDIPGFYVEINRVFMANEDWQLGESLDALDDLLYGGYGALAGQQDGVLQWKDIAHSEHALGVDATRRWLQQKLRQPGRFNIAPLRAQLDALERGEGQTYFDIVLEIIAAHPTLQLVRA